MHQHPRTAQLLSFLAVGVLPAAHGIDERHILLDEQDTPRSCIVHNSVSSEVRRYIHAFTLGYSCRLAARLPLPWICHAADSVAQG